MAIATLRESTIWTPTPTAANTVDKGTGVFPAWQSLVAADLYPGAAASVLINKTTLVSNGTVVSVLSIPAAFSALLITVQGRSDYNNVGVPGVQLCLRVGTGNVIDFGTNYDVAYLQAIGTTYSVTESFAATFLNFGYIPAVQGGASPLTGSSSVLIPGYSNTVFWKAMLTHGSTRHNTTSGTQECHRAGACWKNTAPIDCIQVICGAGQFVAGTVVTLQGVT